MKIRFPYDLISVYTEESHSLFKQLKNRVEYKNNKQPCVRLVKMQEVEDNTWKMYYSEPTIQRSHYTHPSKKSFNILNSSYTEFIESVIDSKALETSSMYDHSNGRCATDTDIELSYFWYLSELINGHLSGSFSEFRVESLPDGYLLDPTIFILNGTYSYIVILPMEKS